MEEKNKKNFKNTKILATLGPVTDTKERIVELINAGIDGVRLNFSHGGHYYYDKVFKNINDACVETSQPIAILIDLQGPKIRVGELVEAAYELKDGDPLEITMDDIVGTNERITCSYKGLVNDANPGESIYIDDGLIKMVVDHKSDTSLFCKVIEGGVLKPRKGINLPGMMLSLPSMTAKDFDDLDFALTHRVDFIALSFVRQSSDITHLRKYLHEKGFEKNIIAKIEKPEGVSNFDEILEAADGIMVARGDLGVELAPQKVPMIQKTIIAKCNQAGKMVITATQMLESMISHPVPTRAETSDVANAVWDGTDVVMLSGETSIGSFADDAVKIMDAIIQETEQHMSLVKTEAIGMPSKDLNNLFDSVGKALATMAVQVGAAAVVSITRRGNMARSLSKFRPKIRIVALSDNFELMNVLSLVWGVSPVFSEDIGDEFEAIKQGLKIMKEKELVNEGDTVIFTSGAPADQKGPDIWIRFATA